MDPQQIPPAQPSQQPPILANPQTLDKTSNRSSRLRFLMVIAGSITAGLVIGVLLSAVSQVSNPKYSDVVTVIEESKKDPVSAAPATPVEGDDLANYDDPELGLHFRYLKKWGTVTKHQKGDPDRSFYFPPEAKSTMDYTFSNAPLILMPLIGKTNTYLVNETGCFLQLGFLNASIDQENISEPYSTDWEQSEISEGNNYGTYSRTVEASKERIVLSTYSVSSIVSKSGYCNGLSIYGQQAVPGNKDVWAVQFIWGESASSFGVNQKPLTVDDLNAFKQNPEAKFSETEMNELRAMLASIQVK